MTVHYRHGSRSRGYYQYLPNQKWAVPRCWSVAASEVDKAVAQEFLRVVTPPQIELALAVTREVEHQATEVDRLWKLRMERLQYEARVAERRYKAVDPDNRVVARTLETEWNEKLLEIDSSDREYQRQCESARLQMSDDDRAKVLKLASDLPALWNAPTTTITEKKNLLRTAIQAVTLHPVDVPERTTRVHLLWEGGATTELIVPRHDKHTANTTSQEVLDIVNTLCAEGQKDLDIAASLNRRGLARKSGKPWDVVAVKRIRQSRGLDLVGSAHTAKRREDGLYSLRGVAARLGVAPGVVYGWRRDGLLEPAAGGGIGHDLWFRLDAATVKALKADKNHHLK